jgi:hypothetical protein
VNSFVLALALCLQDPAASPALETKSVIALKSEFQFYFRGANISEKSFIDGARKAIDSSDNLTKVQKFRLKRKLHRPRFVRMAMDQYKQDVFGNDPSKSVSDIDWNNVDWDKLLSLLLTLLKMFA